MDNQRQADEMKLAILAGFFAGEGSISLKSQYGGGRAKCPALYISLGNTEKFWPEVFQQLFGGSVYVEIPKKFANAKPVWRWRLHNEKASECLRKLLPFLLGEKKQQAYIALRFIEIKKQRVANWKWHTPDQIAAMERLVVELQELRRAVAETKRTSALPVRSDSPTLPVMAD